MTQNEKEMLFKDLSARLPYHVRCKIWLNDGTTEEGLLDLEHNYGNVLQDAFYYNKIKDIKPYLFPISSVTEDQAKELFDLFNISIFDSIGKDYIKINECTGITFFLNRGFDVETHLDKLVDWLNANHFDYRGLIEKHLAIDATLLDVY